MASPEAESGYKVTLQRVRLAELSYQTADNQDDWVRLESAYIWQRIQTITFNLISLEIDGTGLEVWQELSMAGDPHAIPGMRNCDKVIWATKFPVESIEDILLREVAEGPGNWRIAIQFSFRGMPESANASFLKDNDPAHPSTTTLANLASQAQDMPLKKWAEEFQKLGVRRVLLDFKRFTGRSKKFLWNWPAVFDLLSGAVEWKTPYNKAVSVGWQSLHLHQLATHPQSGPRLSKQGDWFKLVQYSATLGQEPQPQQPPQPTPTPATSTTLLPMIKTQDAAGEDKVGGVKRKLDRLEIEDGFLEEQEWELQEKVQTLRKRRQENLEMREELRKSVEGP